MAKESNRDPGSGHDPGSAQNPGSVRDHGSGEDPGSGAAVDPKGPTGPDRNVEPDRHIAPDPTVEPVEHVVLDPTAGPARETKPDRTVEPVREAKPGRTVESVGHLVPDRFDGPAGDGKPGRELEPAPDFDAFYEATHRRTIGQVYAMCGNLHEAEDCVQEAFARAWQRWPALSAGPGDPEAWVRTVAIRLAVSSWRKAVNRLLAHRREAEVTGVPGMNPDHVAVVAALRRISADQRLAIVLQHYGGLSVEEIAAQTGASASAVKARLARGRAALAPHLTEFAQSLEEPERPPPRNRPEFSRSSSQSRSSSRSRQEI